MSRLPGLHGSDAPEARRDIEIGHAIIQLRVRGRVVIASPEIQRERLVELPVVRYITVEFPGAKIFVGISEAD